MYNVEGEALQPGAVAVVSEVEEITFTCSYLLLIGLIIGSGPGKGEESLVWTSLIYVRKKKN